MVAITEERATELAHLADDVAMFEWRHQIVDAIAATDTSVEADALAAAFRYRRDDADPDARQRWGSRMVPSADGNVEPEMLRDTHPDICGVWEAVVTHASHPRVRATLHDLLFERRTCKHLGDHARGAAEAYIAYGLEATNSLDEVDSFRRALELARLTKDADLNSAALEATLVAVDRTLADGSDPRPGITLRLLEALNEHRIDDVRIDALLERCRHVYPDIWNTTNVIDLQRQRAVTNDARRALDREEIEAYLAAADDDHGLRRLAHLESAARIARDRGMRDLGADAILRLQSTRMEDLDFQRFSTEIEIPRERTERQIEALLQGSTWIEAAMRIVGSGPPSGDVVRNREQVDRNAQEFVFTRLATPQLIGADGLPRWTPTNEHEHHDHRMAEVEALNIQFTCALLYAEAFTRAGDKFGPPEVETIAETFGNHVEQRTGAAIVRVVHRYYEGDPEAAAITAMPLIERVARDLLLSVDEPIFRVQVDLSPGKYPGLGALIEQLRPYLDPSWHRFFRTLLASPAGMNLRNEALHGHITDVDQPTAVAVLIGLLYLAALQPSDDQSDVPPNASA